MNIKRYNISGLHPHIIESKDGFMVYYEDYERLKAEVERLTFDPLTYLDDQGEWIPRHIHLAAVERLKAEVDRVTNLKAKADQSETEVDRLKAEGEMLRKAGDALLAEWENTQSGHWAIDDAKPMWNAAKEGKQS